MSLDFSLSGAKELEEKLRDLGPTALVEAGRALYQEALVESKESQRRTPVDTGALRASHEVGKPEISGRDVSVTIRVGGPAAPYALVVHEDLEAHHPVGQAKFLESTLNESAPHMAERVGRRIDLNQVVK
jgi:hypothetical protein